MTFGGNDSPLGRRFLARVNEEVQRRAFPIVAERITIDFATLGGNAGFIGVAGVARLAAQKRTAQPSRQPRSRTVRKASATGRAAVRRRK